MWSTVYRYGIALNVRTAVYVMCCTSLGTQAAFARALSRRTKVHEVPLMGWLCVGNREAARMPVGARWVSCWWESGPSAGVHGFGCTGEGPLRVRAARSGGGDRATMYKGGVTCAGKVNGRLRGWGEC